MMKFVAAALYKFVTLDASKDLQKELFEVCHRLGIKGTLLLAHEGINGTIAGTRQGIDEIISYLRNDPRFVDLEVKESFSEKMPFSRLKVRLKKEIVTIGIPQVNPTQVVGTYVEPEDWNELLSDPEVILIDTRNTYEVAIGSFKGALDPKTNSFREFPQFVQQHLDPKKHKKIAMCCTGGIRCEKASSYMKMQGFEEVYHLKGGILKYLERIPVEKSMWHGECFLFDNRVAVTHGLEVGHYELCHGCRRPLSQSDKQSSFYQPGVSCSQCYHETSTIQKTRFAERQKQLELAKSRQSLR